MAGRAFVCSSRQVASFAVNRGVQVFSYTSDVGVAVRLRRGVRASIAILETKSHGEAPQRQQTYAHALKLLRVYA